MASGIRASRLKAAWLSWPLLMVMFWTSAVLAAPEPRVALVIGNSGYIQAPLRNTVADAHLVATTLRGLGFQVIEQRDADRRAILGAMRAFGEHLRRAGPRAVGLFYYAGHGVQVGGYNYLIPVGALMEGPEDVRREAVSMEALLDELGRAGNATNLIIMDACRNNPFNPGARCLARMFAPEGTLIAYATKPGDIADDGFGDNSPYSSALSRAMRDAGVPVEQMFRLVRNAVMASTGGNQVPWEESSLTGENFYFNPAARRQSGPSPEQVFWSQIKDSRNPAEFAAFLSRFPNGQMASLARVRLQALRTAPQQRAQPRRRSVVPPP